jgi:hypothetical protein
MMIANTERAELVLNREGEHGYESMGGARVSGHTKAAPEYDTNLLTLRVRMKVLPALRYEGFDLSSFQVGMVYEVERRLAELRHDRAGTTPPTRIGHFQTRLAARPGRSRINIRNRESISDWVAWRYPVKGGLAIDRRFTAFMTSTTAESRDLVRRGSSVCNRAGRESPSGLSHFGADRARRMTRGWAKPR